MPKHPDKFLKIVGGIRSQITGGGWKPGRRIPTLRHFSSVFQASSVTVQRALDCLVAEGFIETRGRHGTFVAERPPHLHRYGLVFDTPVTAQSTQYVKAVRDEAVRLRERRQVDIPAFYGVSGPTNLESYRELLLDVESQRLAGLIFPLPPFRWRGTPVLDKPGIPRVMVSGGTEGFPGLHVCRLNNERFLTKALDHFVQCGARRVAALYSFVLLPGFEEHFMSLVAERGMETHPFWIQQMGFNTLGGARNLAHLMMRGAKNERPDALLITDDNLVPMATQGLADAGVRVPEDVVIVAHCNHGALLQASVPVRNLGYDIPSLVATCIQCVDAMRSGAGTPGVTEIEPLFEDEVAAHQPASATAERV